MLKDELTNPRVDECQGIVCLVRDNMDVELWIRLQEVLVLIFETLELDLVQCITGIGDELSQEDFLYQES